MSIPIMPSMTNTEGRMVNAEVEIFVNDIKVDIDPITILVDLTKPVGYLMELIENEIALFKSDNVLAPDATIKSVNSNFLGVPNTISDLMMYPEVILGKIHYTLDTIETATLYVNI